MSILSPIQRVNLLYGYRKKKMKACEITAKGGRDH